MNLKNFFILVVFLTLLFSIGGVFAGDESVILNQTQMDSSDDVFTDFYQMDDVLNADGESVSTAESNEIEIGDWGELQYYSSLNDKNYVLKLKENTNYYPDDPQDSSCQVIFNNNVTIIGASGAYIGDVSPAARNITYTAMKVPDNSGVGIRVKNVTFKWIGTRYQPDGVFLQMGGNSINYFDNCYFTNISTNLGHSSIVYIKLGDAVVTNCTFINCTTDFGCLSVYNPDDDPTDICLSARMNVTESYFEGNYARTEPGCINNCGVLIVRNSTFYRNSAFWWAGAIHTHGGANTTIYDSDFYDNLAGWNGGALYTYSYLQIYNSRFIGNNCTTNNGGGAIGACKYLHAPYIHIEDSLFENNENLCWGLDELSTSGTGRGGAISLMDSGGLEVYNSTFIKNSASIGTAICAISGGLSYGSPDVRIVGNRFINHTRVGDVLDVRVATGSVAEVSDNYFYNNSIVFTKLKLSADDPDSSGRVSFHLDAALKNPASYDEDILDKSDYDVYVNGEYEKTVNSRDFTLDLGRGRTAQVYVVPCISNSKSNEVLAGKVKQYIYVSQNRGNDNNDGLSRSNPVKTLNKSIELARSTENIVIMDGTFTETNLIIDYNLTITAESGVVIKVTGNAFTITDGDVMFENVAFKNCKYGSSTKTKLINQSCNGFLTLSGCVFENNEYKTHIEADGKVEAENLRVTNCRDGSFIRANSITIKSSQFHDNTVTYTLYKSILSYKTQTDKFVAENLTFTGNTVFSGCIGVKKNKATVTDCSFIGNTIGTASSCRASGIHIEDSCSLLVEGCKFINNTDTGKYASVIYITSGTLLIRDSILINNSYENTNGVVINGGETYLKKLQASNNWWGNTPDNLTKPALKVYSPSNQLPNGWDPAQTWLVLNATVLSSEIELNERVPVQFIFTQIDNEGNVTGYDGVKMPEFELKLTAVNGTCSNSKIRVVNGMATTYFTLTQKSNASLTGSFNGIDVTVNFQFKKSVPEMNVSTQDILVGDIAGIEVSMQSGVTGSVILKVGNITETKTLSNSKATFSIAGLAAGNHTVEVNYTGNDRFESAVSTANLTVSRHNSTTVLSHGNLEVNTDAVFTVTLSDGATGTVDVYVNGVKHTINAGDTYTISNIPKGDYVVRAVYGGDSYYLPSEDECVFDVGKAIPSMTVTAPDITYGQDTIVTVNLNSDASGSVAVTVDGKTNTSQVKNGKATVSISGISAGTNKIIDIAYSGDSNYRNATAAKTYSVGKANLNFTVNANSIRLGQDAVVTIQLPQRSGGTLTISGIKSETKNVPLTGIVTLTYSDLEVGTYTVNVRYDGDNYLTASKSATFEVSDWTAPQWPNQGYDVKNTETSPYSSDANGNVKWVKDIDGTVIGNMAIDSEGRLYITTSNGIYSINPDDGSTSWIFNSQDAGGNFSGIAISRDVILAPKEGDKLYFINQTTGEKYNNNMYQASSSFAPIVDDNANIYISGEYYGSEPTRVVVVPYKIWQTSTAPVEIQIGDYEITSSPVLVNNEIIVFTTNTTLMIVDINSKSVSSNIPIVCNSNPVAGPGNIIYVISNGKVFSYDGVGSKVKDVAITGTAGNYLSVGVNGEIYSINCEGKLFDYSTGEETLIYDFKEPVSSRLLVGKDSNLYVGSDSGVLYSIDNEGNLLWKVNLNQSVSASPVMDENGVIYIISGNRIVAIDKATLKDSKLTAQISNVTYGRDAVVNVNLDSLATGIVSIKVGNSYINESAVEDGKASFTIPGLSGGNYTAEINYNGDACFNSKKISVKFTVGKIDPTMNVDFNNSIKAGEVLLINVTELPADATGTVSVSAGGKSNSSNVRNGKADLSISGLAKGEYPVVVTYSGDVNYNEKTVTNPVSVGYVQSSFNAVSSDVNVGSNVLINISGLASDANGVFYVNYNNQNYADYVSNGKAQITINDLANGTYDFDVFYINDTKYSANSKKVHVTVSKINTKFTVTVTDINVNDDLVVDVSGLPGDATGLVVASVEGLSGNSSVGNGNATIRIPQSLDNGTYTVNVTYVGDNKYNGINKEKTIRITKIAAEFKVSVSNIYVGDDLVVDVFGLPNDATGQITASIKDIINTSAITNGASAAIILHQRLPNGTYQVEISYSGDRRYDPLSKTKSVNISKITPPISAGAKDEIKVGDDLTITVSGIPTDTGVRYIDILGDITNKTLINGDNAQITISGLAYGKYSYYIYYGGDDRYNAVRIDKTLDVNKNKINVTASVENVDFGRTPVVKVTGLPGDASDDVIVNVINVGEYPSPVSDGKADVYLYGLDAGSYTAVVSYIDEKYESASKTLSFKISKIDPSVTIEAGDIHVGDVLNVTVILPNDATGNVTVGVGDNFAAVSVKEGIANVCFENLTAGSQTVTVQYGGDINYNPLSDSKTVSVNKLPVFLQITADDSIEVGSVLEITVKLPDDASGNVDVIVDGRVADSAGVSGDVSLVIRDLSAGTRNYTVVYSGDARYESNSTLRQVTVNKKDSQMNISAPDNIYVTEELVITVNLPDDAEGELNVSLAGQSKVVSVKNNAVTFTDLSAGTQTVTVHYSGDRNYNSTTRSKVISVNKVDIALDIVADESIEVGDALNITVYLPDAGGSVTVSVDGSAVDSAGVSSGVVRLTVPDLSAGNHSYTVSYSGDGRFNPNSDVKNVTVNKRDSNMAVAADNIDAGEDLIIKVILPEDAKGNVIISINGNAESVEIDKGIVNYVVSDLNKGSYQLNVSYDGDGKYASADYSKSIDVGKQNVTFDVSSQNADYGEDVIVKVEGLPGDASGNVTLTLNNKQQYSSGVSNGKAVFKISGLNAGSYDGAVSYSNDEKYMANQKSVSFIVSQIDPAIAVDVCDISVGDKLTVYVTLPEDAAGALNISVGGQSKIVNVKTGFAVISDLDAGNHTVSVQYSGDVNYNSITEYKVISVNKLDIDMDIAAEQSIEVGDVLNVTVYLPDATGDVRVSVDGKIADSASVGSGVARLSISDLSAGNHSYTVSYGGDAKFNPTSAVGKVTVNRKESRMEITADDIKVGEDLTVKVTLPGDATGNVSVSAGDRVFTSKLIDGAVSFTISSLTGDIDRIDVDYSGDDKYAPASQSKSITVSKINPAIIISAEDISVGESLSVTVELPGDATGKVSVNVSGISKTANVNNGVSSVSISGLTSGSHVIYVSYLGNEKYNSVSASKAITVNKLNPVIAVTADDIKYGQNLIVRVNLAGDACGNVSVIVDGESHDVEINEGTAVLNVTGLNAGYKPIDVYYAGDDRYNQASNYTTANVNKATPIITVSAEDIECGNPLKVEVQLSDKINADLTLSLGNVSRLLKATDGVASVEIQGLNSGSYTINVRFEGNSNYNAASASKTVTVSKVNPVIYIEAGDVTYGEDLLVRVALAGDATGNVTVTVDGISQTLELVRGSATANFTGLNAGDKAIDVTYEGDDKYNAASNSTSAVVNRIVPIITVSADNIRYGESLNVEIQLSENISANLTVSAGEVSKTVRAVDGAASAEISGLNAGSHTVEVRFGGSQNYASSDSSVTVNVGKITPGLIIDAEDIRYGENLTVGVKLNGDATGNVQISVGGVSKTIALKDGAATLTISGLTAGSKNVNVKYAGDGNYYSASGARQIAVSKLDTPLIIMAEDIESGENLNVKVNLDEGTTGNVIISVGDIHQTAKIEDGVAQIIISGLAAGTHTVSVKYDGDINYNGAENSTEVSVSGAEIPVSEDSISDSGNSSVYSISLPGDASGTLTVRIDGKNYTAKLLNGKAAVDVDNLAPGNYTVEIDYSGDGKYSSVSKTTKLEVPKVKTKTNETIDIDVSDDSNSSSFSINLPDDATGTLTVSVDGVNYTARLISGKATVDVENLSKGNHDVVVTYSGDSRYSPIAKYSTVTINETAKKAAELSVTAADITVGENAVINIKSNVKSGKVTVTLNNRTDILELSEGRAVMSVPDLTAGRYAVTVKFDGDGEYLEAENSTVFTVSKKDVPATDDVFPDSGNPSVYSINMPSDATGTLTVTVDGVDYTEKLANGRATVTIPELSGGSHNIRMTYSGDAKYSSIVKDRIVNVPVINLTGSDVTMLYTGGDSYRVRLTQDGAPLAGKTVDITIDGRTYPCVTGNDGYASLKIDLAPKTYTATAVYGKLNVTNTVVVKSIVKAKNVKAKKSAKSIKVKVRLKKVNGKYIVGKKVKLKFNKKKFKAKTNTKGVATFKIKKSVYKKLKAGKKYKYQAKYGKNKVKKTITFKK